MFFALNECNVLQGFYFFRSIKFVKLKLNLYLCNVRMINNCQYDKMSVNMTKWQRIKFFYSLARFLQ